MLLQQLLKMRIAENESAARQAEGVAGMTEEDFKNLDEFSEAVQCFASCAKKIADALSDTIESVQRAISEIIPQIIPPIWHEVKRLLNLIAKETDAQPKTITPRGVVRVVGCRPFTFNSATDAHHIRNGCRHK